MCTSRLAFCLGHAEMNCWAFIVLPPSPFLGRRCFRGMSPEMKNKILETTMELEMGTRGFHDKKWPPMHYAIYTHKKCFPLFSCILLFFLFNFLWLFWGVPRNRVFILFEFLIHFLAKQHPDITFLVTWIWRVPLASGTVVSKIISRWTAMIKIHKWQVQTSQATEGTWVPISTDLHWSLELHPAQNWKYSRLQK